jgi:hypothetical protein
MMIRYAARALFTACTLACTFAVAITASAQDKVKPKKDSTKVKALKDSARAAAPKVSPLWASATPLELTLKTNLKMLRRDKGENSPYHTATFTYTDADGKAVEVPLRVKTHGIWRLKHCANPPLRLNFSNKVAKGTVFHDAERPKMVSPCENNKDSEQYVLQEFQLYRIYQLVTPMSHQARLIHVAFVDSATGKADTPKYAFLFEDPDVMATRLGGTLIKQKGAGPDDLNADAAGIAFLFEYMIGNTDFSFWGLHNGELVGLPNGDNLPVGYDFDFSGAVNTHYATVDPQLGIKRVRQRLFRGHCQQNASIPLAIATFQTQKRAIYALYTDEIGKLLDPSIVKETLQYWDEFYQTLEHPKDFLSSCEGKN